MISIDTLTLGNEFKNSQGEIYQVISNMSDENKIYIELKKVEASEQLIPEK